MAIALKWKDLIEKGALASAQKQILSKLAGYLDDFFHLCTDEGQLINFEEMICKL